MPYDGLLKQNPIVDHSFRIGSVRLVVHPFCFRAFVRRLLKNSFGMKSSPSASFEDHRGSQKILIRHEILDREISRVYSFKGPHVNIWEKTGNSSRDRPALRSRIASSTNRRT